MLLDAPLHLYERLGDHPRTNIIYICPEPTIWFLERFQTLPTIGIRGWAGLYAVFDSNW